MLLSLFLSFVAYLALRCVHNPVNFLSVICSPRISVLSSFGRETSLVNITYPGPYPHYCFHAHLLFCFYFQLFVSVCRSASVAPLTPTYHLWSPTGDKPWYLY